MMDRLLDRVAKLWQRFEDKEGKERWVRNIYRDGAPLIVRYYVCSTRWIDDSDFFKKHPKLQRWLSWASFRVVIHHMHQSDDDGLHDHPWPWCSWVLSGGYWENTPEGMFWRWPGHLRFRSANSFHRLILDPNSTGKGVYTLFAMGQRQKEWGFLVDRDNKKVWEPWYDHHGLTRYEFGDTPKTVQDVSRIE
jgi:hypothetical protein